MSRKEWSLIVVAAMVVVAALATLCLAGAVNFNGERLVYEFGWQAISAATAEVTVAAVSFGGESCYRATIQVRGKPKLDWIWKVRDKLESISNAQTLRCRVFTFQQRESNFNADTTIRLDPARNLLISTRTRYRNDGPRPMKSFTAPPDHLDPLGALLYVRQAELAVGRTYALNVFDGKRSHVLNYDVLALERVKIGIGEFDAYKIWPRIVKSSGDDAESKVNKVRKAYLWIDKNPPHHMLKIESEVFVGHIYAELIQR